MFSMLNSIVFIVIYIVLNIHQLIHILWLFLSSNLKIKK